jgi:Heparinase II/III-like protein
MPGSRLAVAAVVAACCAAMAVAALGGSAGSVPHAGDPPPRTQPPVRPRPTLVAPQLAAPQLVAPQLAAVPSAGPLADQTPATSSSPPASGAARACGGLPQFNAATADEIMAGRLTVAPFPAVTIDPNRDGDVNWELNPFGNPTWGQDFRSGGWIEDLVAAYLAGGPQAGAYQARAKQLAAGWLAALPPSGRDPRTLVCLAQAFPGQSWINDQIPPTVNYYAAHWMGAWNHGLMQDIKLLSIGCGYPPGAFGGDALRWRTTAVAQLIAAFEPNRLGPAIDGQGAVNEQATLYEDFVYNLWRTALPELTACGYHLPGWITARIARLPAFLGYATEPDGDLVQIGDSYVEHPKTSPRGGALVAVYRQAGYVFGRSGWTPAASFYSLRFGPGREIHGHEDHLGLTYYARGRDLIVDAGHYGYTATPYRAWLQSPEAASTLVLPGVPFSGAADTSLIADRIGRYGQFYELYDTAFGGDPRYRSVYVSQRPDLMLVFDRARGGSAASAYSQLWHLDPALRVTEIGPSSASASAPGTKLTLAQVALPGQVIPPGSTQVARGQTDPYQGWVSDQMLQRTPADVVTMTGTGPSAAILTLLVPTAPSTPVAHSVTGTPAGPWRLRVTVGASVSWYTISANGDISADARGLRRARGLRQELQRDHRRGRRSALLAVIRST